MKVYEFKRNEIQSVEDYYNLIQRQMNLPKWFGKNADALWDMLTGFIETPCQIILSGFANKTNNCIDLSLNLINQCFVDAGNEFPDKFQIVFK